MKAAYGIRITASILLFLLAACDSQTRVPEPPGLHSQPVERKAVPYLEESYAAMRAGQISKVDYQLSVELNEQTTEFSGVLVASFTLAENNRADVTVDFNGGDVKKVLLNSEPVIWQYNGWFITIDAELIPVGENTLHIEYSRPYATDGDGLHRYIDPETDNQYLYTNFEPYNANKLFPHFDQPNIKARYTLDVKAPANWHVISATRETTIEEADNTKHWHFPQSAPIPSYIFPLHAGPYHVWEETYTKGDYSVPMRLFARPELAEFVVEEDWFTYTTQSFDFFNDYFNLPYMFDKYDQLIVPDFNAGAMENLGAVTFTERFISRGEQIETQRIRLANVIAHEMAHMWFGNLVTMDWWNGLWLNESFATYMAYLQLAEASDFDNTWDIFYSRTKQWAYETDQQVTTHPIELPVPTTADAFANFDGITYGKGASVLKQLPYYLGEENFRKGVSNYLREHAYDNTELSDFIGALGEAAGKDLNTWTEQWLYTAGLNSLRAEYRCDHGQLMNLTLLQTAPEDHPTLRSQRVQVGLFAVTTGDDAELIARLPVTYEGAKTPVEIPKNTACPDLVYPNLDDWGYVKVELDEKSRSTLESGIHQFADDSLRIMLWQALWDSVRDVNWPVTAFVSFAITQLPAEDNDRNISQVAAQLKDSSDYLWLMASEGNEYGAERHAIANLFWTQANQAEAGSDQQKIWFDYWVRVASNKTDLNNAQALLQGQDQIEGLTLDQDRRWNLVLLLNRFAHGDYQQLTEAEAEGDSSDRGQQNALAAEATRPQSEMKEKWLGHITEVDSDYKLAQLRTVMLHLFPANQTQLLDAHGDTILAAIPSLTKEKEERFMRLYTSYMLPATCTTESAERLDKAIEEHADLSPSVGKGLKISHQEDQRCVDMKGLLN